MASQTTKKAAAVAAGATTTVLTSQTLRREDDFPTLAGSWVDLGAGDVDEGLRALAPELRRDEKAVAALGGDVARRALALGAELARDPAVQRAIAARAGRAEAETEAETLRKMVATLSAELEELRGERGGGDEALAKSLETQREALAFDGGELEDVPSLASEPSAADPIDELFARLDGGDFADGGADGEKPGGAEPRKPGGAEPDVGDAVLGAALAIASLVCLVVVTRKLNPTLVKRAAVLSAAAIAGILSKFHERDEDR